MENLSERDLVRCINSAVPQRGMLGVVFQFREGMVDVDFRWGGGGLYRCPLGDFELVERDWNGKWLAARAAGEPEYPLPAVSVDMVS